MNLSIIVLFYQEKNHSVDFFGKHTLLQYREFDDVVLMYHIASLMDAWDRFCLWTGLKKNHILVHLVKTTTFIVCSLRAHWWDGS